LFWAYKYDDQDNVVENTTDPESSRVQKSEYSYERTGHDAKETIMGA
jgi:hypothetical protein